VTVGLINKKNEPETEKSGTEFLIGFKSAKQNDTDPFNIMKVTVNKKVIERTGHISAI